MSEPRRAPAWPAIARRMRSLIVGAGRTAAYRCGALSLVRWMGAPGWAMPVLQFHSVSVAGTYRAPSIAVSPALFERQAAFLAERYSVISLDEVVDCLVRGRPFPRRAVALTFDDGYRDNVELACPILARHGLTATFFVTAGPVARGERFWVSWLRSAVSDAADVAGLVAAGIVPASLGGAGRADRRAAIIGHLTAEANRVDSTAREALLARVATALPWAGGPPGPEEMLRPADLRALVRAGMTVGSHTVSHPNLPSLGAGEALRELVESKRMLEDLAGETVRHLAYPGGPDPAQPIFTAETLTLARRAGYVSASSSDRAVVTRRSDRFALPRYDVNERHGVAGFAFRLEQHRFLGARTRSRRPRNADDPEGAR